MLSTEMKTYLQVLKSKVKTSPYKEVEITGTQIKVRGEKKNADTLYVLNCGTKGNGIYTPEALDMLLLDIEANIDAYRKGDAENWQIADYQTDSSLHITKEIMDDLVEASKYASNDDFRPALQRVHFYNGDIMATDGYRGYVKRVGEIKNANLTPSTIAVIKKCFKYGDWHCAIGHTPWSENTQQVFNGYFTIWEKGLETSTTPDLRKLLEDKPMDMDTLITIPYKTIKEVAKKGDVLDLDRDTEASEELYTLTLDGKNLPLRASGQDFSATPVKGDTLKVIMPRVEDGHFLSLNFALLNCIKEDKDGNVNLAIKTGRKDPLAKDLKAILLVI